MSALIAVILYPLFGLNILWVFVGGYLIDIDHYFYGFKFKQYNLLESIKFWRKPHKFKPLFVFHLIEFWLIMLILSYFNQTIMLITVGGITHITADIAAQGRDRQWSILKRKAYK